MAYLEQASPAWIVWLAPAATVLAAIVSNIVIWRKVRADLSTSLEKEHHMRILARLSEKLEKFYNPIHALTRVNTEVFSAFGPKTAREQDPRLNEEAANLWTHLVTTVVLPNNKIIRETIIKHGHLAISQEEQDASYRFVRHSLSYEAFRTSPNSQHKAYPYPTDFFSVVDAGRKSTLDELRLAESRLKPN